MQCAKCGADNKTGAKFCINCGSSMGVYCPNCGAANTTGAKFCVSCGNQFGGSVTQPMVVVKTGVPSWAWGVLGVLLAIALISGLAFSGVLPLNFASNDGSTPPPLQPVLSSPEVSTEVVFCPQTGGVILYWNAGFDCSNDAGDLGFRLRYGDGFQNLNTGHFDDQASSIHIPAGWSVRLYENTGRNGASRCFNSSISNFEDFGTFDDRDLPVNDNVTSMEIFRDGTCGQDLAAGAEPAPISDEETPPEPPNGNAAGAQGPVCDCDCVQAQFPGLDFRLDGFDVPFDQFSKEYGVDGYYTLDPPTGHLEFDNKNGTFDKLMEASNLQFEVVYYSKDNVGQDVMISTKPVEPQVQMNCNKEGTKIHCQHEAEAKQFLNEDWRNANFRIYSYNPELDWWELCLYTNDKDPGKVFGLAPWAGIDNGEGLDCRNYGCPSGEECVEYKQFGTFGCEPIQQQSQPTGDDQSGGSSGGCTAGCWCEIGGVWGCWQSCNSWCVDP